MTSSLLLGLGSTFLFGLRHGIDYDHVAAISDLTSVERDRGRAFRLGMIYAFGHAVVIVALGFAAIALGANLPRSIDALMERVVGATLIVLGVYVVWSLVDQARNGVLNERPASRITILRRLLGGRFASSGRRSAFVIGMLHGIGAETPTQLGLFLFAAGVGGRVLGALGVGLFVVGLLTTNTIMCFVATRVLKPENIGWQRGLAAASALYSLIVGVVFLLT